MFCREWLAQLEQHKPELEKAGLQIVAVGLGETKHAKRYCGKLAPSITCLTDETTTPYLEYGLRHTVPKEMLSLGLVGATARALARGHIQGQATGDVRMLPGTFIVDTQGRIRYTYYSKHPGDDPGMSDLVAAVEQFTKT